MQISDFKLKVAERATHCAWMVGHVSVRQSAFFNLKSSIRLLNFIFGILVFFLPACSGTKWVIQPDPVVDYRSGTVVDSYEYIRQLNEPTPRQPVVQFELRTVNVTEYPQRVESQRYVQRYTPRPGLLAVSLAASAAVFYVANAPNVASEGSFENQKLILNSAGAVLALSGLLAMRPDGKPVATEEKRLLGQTGTVALRDTVSYVSDAVDEARVSVRYKGQVLVDSLRKEFLRGRLVLDLAREVPNLPASGVDPGVLEVTVASRDARSVTDIPVESVLAQYVTVTAESTPLRSGPREVPSNILTDIAQGSQLQYQETYDQQWIRVLYGVASTYVAREDVELVWRAVVPSNESLVITEREASFGSIDVEAGIPAASATDPRAFAVLVGNSDFLTGIPRKREASRNVNIVQRYVESAAGVPPNRVLSMVNPERFDFEELFAFGNRSTGLRMRLDDSSKLFVFLSGRGLLAGNDPESLYLLPSDSRPDDLTIAAVRLADLFRALGRLPFAQCVVVLDTEFGTSSMWDDSRAPASPVPRQVLEEAAASFLNRPNTALLVGAQPGQFAGAYTSADGKTDNRYGIASYFFVKAIKEHRKTVGDIFRYMDNNVNFTSRLLHNRPQDPMLLGNPDLQIVP